MKNVEICYGENLKRPLLCSKKSIQLNPSEYKQYPEIFEKWPQNHFNIWTILIYLV